MKLIRHSLFTLSGWVDMFMNRRYKAPENIDKDIKIFVFQHFKVDLPTCFDNRAVYIPIQGGGDDIGALSDVSQPSISEYNLFLNEMTQIYWIGKHYQQLGDPAYVGFAHYRRCLDWNLESLSPGILFASVIVTRYSVHRFFIAYHGDHWLNKFMIEFKKVFTEPEYDDIEKFWKSHCLYVANNFITDRDSFSRYFLFIEKCLEICIRFLRGNIEQFRSMDKGQRRQFGYIMERMTGYWIWHEKRCGRIKVITTRLKCYDIDNGLTSVR